MRITRLTPDQARAVNERLARAALFLRQIIEGCLAIARQAAEALQPLARLSEQLRSHGSYRPEWANHLAFKPGRS